VLQDRGELIELRFELLRCGWQYAAFYAEAELVDDGLLALGGGDGDVPAGLGE
jgi:hypothetical protein